MAIFNMVYGKNATALQVKSESYTPTESVQTDQITPDVGYDGLNEVNVTVDAISPTYVGSGIPRKTSADLTVSGDTVTAPSGYYTANASASVASGSATTPATSITATVNISVSSGGLITATTSASQSVTPTVSAGYVSSGTAGTVSVSGSNTSQLSTQGATTITPTTSSQTAVAAGKYTTGAVTVAAMPSGTAGTPTATKGTVSSHSVTVTPSVTNTTGYITGGTKTGTGVTVSASELVSGTYSVTGAGTADVTNYASISVPSGTAGTPTATKGAVSNHSISVTPSVTNTAGYISGGTNTGTAVSVSASELVSGTKSITSNGTGIDVTDYASVDVSVSGGGLVWQDQYGYVHISDQAGGATCILKNITSNGTYLASNDSADGYSVVNVNVSGGGGEPARKKQINFIDYDGTILYSYTKTEWQSVSTLPSNPSHSGLTAQGWNWNKNQIDAQLTAMPDGDVWVGQMYITQSGDTEIDVTFADSTRLSPILTIAVNGTVTVDWGDNTATDTVTGSSLTTRQSVPHTYSTVGSYTIKIHVTSGSFTFYVGSSSYSLLRRSALQSENRVYANCVKAIRLGSGITSIGSYAFHVCYSLETITIPSGVTTLNNYMFNYCASLKSITIPSVVTSLPSNAFYDSYSLTSASIPSGITSIGGSWLHNCYALESITIPSGVTSLGSNTFYNCYSLASVTIPSGVTSFDAAMFYTCGSLASVTIPSGVTSLGNNVFANCGGIAEHHVKPTTPPTLGTNVFSGIADDCIIYVPSASLTDYQTDANWSAYASYMVGE